MDRSHLDSYDVVVIGAGQAGLSAAYHLARAGVDPSDGFVVLDDADRPGGAWQHRWPGLTMATVHGIHELPGFPVPELDRGRPARSAVPDYFAAYEARFELPIRRPVSVRAVRPGPADRLLVETATGTWTARAVINATGTWQRPFRPYYAGAETFRGRQLHTAEYAGPAEFAGQHVVVVGGGTSAVQLLTEIATLADTTWVTRRAPVFQDRPFSEEVGRAAVARIDDAVRHGRVPGSVVAATGLFRTPAVDTALSAGVLDRRPMFDRITPKGVEWADGSSQPADAIVWATGFRPALGHLAPLRLREPGGGIRMDGTRVVREPRLHLVGYGPSASTIGANRAGRVAVRDIRGLLLDRSLADTG